MSGKNKHDQKQTPAKTEDKTTDAGKAEDLSVGRWRAQRDPKWRSFPGPRSVSIPLRVAAERAAYAEVVAHAKESLDAEICGVLVGTECQDDEGPFVHVEAAVRGTRADEGTAHVTYTQETWNSIYAAIERDYPKLQIVGWYHSHPGFGVEFSDMDIFIQKNFFSGATQIGLVTDPLGGEMAICTNASEGIQYLDRCWVDGREQRCRTPASRRNDSAAASDGGGAPSISYQSLETRINQLVQTLDEMRQSYYRLLFTLGMLATCVLMMFVFWIVWQTIFPPFSEPPKNISFQRIPVTIDGKPSLVGIQFVQWQLPPEMVTVFTKLEEAQKAAAEAEAAKQEDGKKDGQPPAKKPAGQPGGSFAPTPGASPQGNGTAPANKGATP